MAGSRPNGESYNAHSGFPSKGRWSDQLYACVSVLMVSFFVEWHLLKTNMRMGRVESVWGPAVWCAFLSAIQQYTTVGAHGDTGDRRVIYASTTHHQGRYL